MGRYLKNAVLVGKNDLQAPLVGRVGILYFPPTGNSLYVLKRGCDISLIIAFPLLTIRRSFVIQFCWTIFFSLFLLVTDNDKYQAMKPRAKILYTEEDQYILSTLHCPSLRTKYRHCKLNL